MLLPGKIKYKKQHKGRIRGKSCRGTRISFGSYALLATSSGFMPLKQIEAARIVMNRLIKKTGKLWIRVFPYKPLTRKPAEIRMGKGKGSVDQWVAVIKPGKILYELDGVDEDTARRAVRLAQAKISVATKFIAKKEDF